MAKSKGYTARALTILFYGMARGEARAAERIAISARVLEHRKIELPVLREIGDAGSKESFKALPPTYIPMRNAVYYSLASSYAEEVAADFIIGGHNGDDAKIFEDARAEFFKNLQLAFWSASGRLRSRRTSILRPLQHMTKPEVIKRAEKLRVPLELTWSCHRDERTHCWKCEGCLMRMTAFDRAGVRDPLRSL